MINYTQAFLHNPLTEDIFLKDFWEIWNTISRIYWRNLSRYYMHSDICKYRPIFNPTILCYSSSNISPFDEIQHSYGPNISINNEERSLREPSKMEKTKHQPHYWDNFITMVRSSCRYWGSSWLFYIFFRTYYEPPLLKDDGHILYMPLNKENVVVETAFEIDPKNQFDQVCIHTCSNEETFL